MGEFFLNMQKNQYVGSEDILNIPLKELNSVHFSKHIPFDIETVWSVLKTSTFP